MAGPPSAVRVGASPRASVPASRSDTTAYPRRGHGRGRLTGWADGAPDPVRTGTSVQVCSSQIRASCHADAARDCRMSRASQSAATTHRKFDESHRHPADCPSWKQTDRKIPADPPNDVHVARYSQRAPCMSRHAKERVCLAEFAAADRQYRLRQIHVLKLKIARFTQTHARYAQQPEQAMIGPWQQCTPFIVVWHLQRGM